MRFLLRKPSHKGQKHTNYQNEMVSWNTELNRTIFQNDRIIQMSLFHVLCHYFIKKMCPSSQSIQKKIPNLYTTVIIIQG